MTKVSVLMSVFNTKIEYLSVAIESILRQTLHDLEFIIVNDGSTDQEVNFFLSTCSSKDPRIKIFCNQENIGLTKSLNRGLRECTGRYIARMDSDDIALPERLYKQFYFMENHPEIDVLGTDVEQIGNKEIHVPKFKNYMAEDDEVFEVKMLFNNVGPIHPTVMLRKSFLDKKSIIYRESMKKAQDYALWIDCLKNGGKFECLEEKLLQYRIHENQITTHSTNEQLRFKQIIGQEYIEEQFGINNKCANVLTTLYTAQFEYPISEYVKTIKNILKLNTVYSSKVLEKELKTRWIHKVIKNIWFSKDFTGMCCLYTYECFFSSAFFEWIRSIR